VYGRLRVADPYNPNDGDPDIESKARAKGNIQVEHHTMTESTRGLQFVELLLWKHRYHGSAIR